MATKHKGKPNEVRASDAYISLRRAGNVIAAKLNRHITENNLTSGQFGILEALFHLGSLSQRELAKKVLSSKGNITMIIDNLEKQGFVKRTADPNDRRVFIIQLTPNGKTFIGKIVPSHIEKITQMMSVLTIDELKELKRLCKKVGLSINQEQS